MTVSYSLARVLGFEGLMLSSRMICPWLSILQKVKCFDVRYIS